MLQKDIDAHALKPKHASSAYSFYPDGVFSLTPVGNERPHTVWQSANGNVSLIIEPVRSSQPRFETDCQNCQCDQSDDADESVDEPDQDEEPDPNEAFVKKYNAIKYDPAAVLELQQAIKELPDWLLLNLTDKLSDNHIIAVYRQLTKRFITSNDPELLKKKLWLENKLLKIYKSRKGVRGFFKKVYHETLLSYRRSCTEISCYWRSVTLRASYGSTVGTQRYS